MLVFFEMVSSLYQGALRIFKKNLIEIQYSALFISTVIVNKVSVASWLVAQMGLTV